MSLTITYKFVASLPYHYSASHAAAAVGAADSAATSQHTAPAQAPGVRNSVVSLVGHCSDDCRWSDWSSWSGTSY